MNAMASLIKLGQRRFVAIAIASGVAVSGSMIYTASNAAFTASTDNGTNNWNTGSVLLEDDDSNGARFTINNMVSNAGGGGTTLTGAKCIVVTYQGGLTANVKFRVGAGSANPSTDDAVVTTGTKLGDYINLKVEQGTGAATFLGDAGHECGTEFTPDTDGPAGDGVLFNGSLTSFVSTHTNFANAAPASGTKWTPTAAGQAKVYRLTWNATALPDRVGVMGKAFTCSFVWEAKSA
jgi:hypothetical protein